MVRASWLARSNEPPVLSYSPLPLCARFLQTFRAAIYGDCGRKSEAIAYSPRICRITSAAWHRWKSAERNGCAPCPLECLETLARLETFSNRPLWRRGPTSGLPATGLFRQGVVSGSAPGGNLVNNGRPGTGLGCGTEARNYDTLVKRDGLLGGQHQGLRCHVFRGHGSQLV